jgi:hypothetical protein
MCRYCVFVTERVVLLFLLPFLFPLLLLLLLLLLVLSSSLSFSSLGSSSSLFLLSSSYYPLPISPFFSSFFFLSYFFLFLWILLKMVYFCSAVNNKYWERRKECDVTHLSFCAAQREAPTVYERNMSTEQWQHEPGHEQNNLSQQLCPPQIPHRWAWDRTRASAVTGTPKHLSGYTNRAVH